MFPGWKEFNAPLDIYWAGWKTNSYELYQNGWELSANQDVPRGTMQIAIQHKQFNLQGITNLRDFTYMERNPSMPFPVQFFDLQALGGEILVQASDHKISFSPISGIPTWKEVNYHRLEDIVHFHRPEEPKKEIYLHEASMDQILQMALDKQAPVQAEIRANARKRAQREANVGRLYAGLRLVA